MDKGKQRDVMFQPQMASGSSQGELAELKKRIRKVWGNLSDVEIEHCEDQRENFLRAVEKKYGIPLEKAEKTLRDIERQCGIAA